MGWTGPSWVRVRTVIRACELHTALCKLARMCGGLHTHPVHAGLLHSYSQSFYVIMVYRHVIIRQSPLCISQL